MTLFHTTVKQALAIVIATGLLLLTHPITGYGQEEEAPAELSAMDSTLATLDSFIKLKTDLKKDIDRLNRQLKAAKSDTERNGLNQQLDKLEADLQTTTRNFENITAGVDLSSLRVGPAKKFNFQEELLALLKPALDEMKEMTSHVRQKSELKERIAYYEERLPGIQQALSNISQLEKQSKTKALKKSLKETARNWQKQLTFMQSELQAAQLQLAKLVASEASLAEASQNYLKSFFQKRGLYLTEAFLVVMGIILLSRLSYSAMARLIPGFRKQHRSFRTRLLELLHRFFTVILLIIGPMIVFYLVEDWVLFSLGILLLIGIAWTLRQALPRYWHQIQLFLNIGSVREGERILMDGLPWRVESINVFCTLVNPTAELSQRVPLNDMVDLKSRPSRREEPWFPCRRDDWVILSDGVRGKVIGITQELVQLVERGGMLKTYQTADFLAASPRNLATNFRLKETLGISYSLQRESTTSIPETLHKYLLERIDQEGYTEKLVNLRVEFALANNSSLDLAIIADFSGELGDLYNRLRRAIQRWCVDACSEYDWEIPFPQMTLHGTVGREIP